MAEARKQSSQSWRPAYAAAALVQYMRDGFAEPSRATPRSWTAPTAPAAVANVPADGITVTTEQASIDITVTYTDDKQVDVASLGDGDVRLVSREEGGRSLPATLVNVDDPSGDGTGPVTATYRFAATNGVWRRADRGRYRVVIQPGEVSDTANFVMSGGPVGQLSLEVLKAPDPPRVAKLKVRAGKGPSSVTVKFLGDVSASLQTGSLTLTTDDGQSIDPATMAVAWDAKANAATWTFPGLADGRLPAGRYRVTLRAAEIADASGRHLDGNKDGIAGDDFTATNTFKIKG